MVIGLFILVASWYWNHISYGHGNFSMNDPSVFEEQPKIVIKNDRYYLRFHYGSWACHFTTKRRIAGDQLIFSVPVQTSSGCPKNSLAFEEITDPRKIELIKKRKVFWEEPNRVLLSLEVESMEEDLEKN